MDFLGSMCLSLLDTLAYDGSEDIKAPNRMRYQDEKDLVSIMRR